MAKWTVTQTGSSLSYVMHVVCAGDADEAMPPPILSYGQPLPVSA